MSDLIISVSGLRGIVGESLTPENATRYAAAFASTCPASRPIIVGRDGRSTGPMLRSAVIAGITAAGRNAIDVDVVATPTIGVLVKNRGAAGAVQITASHNPPPYNGIKLFGEDGRVIGNRGDDVTRRYHAGDVGYVTHQTIGTIDRDDDPHSPHLESVLDTVDMIAIRKAAPKVLLDANHGSGGILGRRLLESLGCNVVCLGEEPNGQFVHPPEPTAANLRDVGAEVVAAGCAMGLCQDPDADRLALIDETGRYIGEECTLALCVQRILSNPATRGPIVINAATSSMSERIAQKYNVGCHRSSVGEANVADLMIEVGAAYGGEGNGGPIDPAVGYVRDSFVAMAQIIDAMVRSGEPLSSMATSLPASSMHKSKVSVEGKSIPDLIETIGRTFSDAEADASDGLRLRWDDRWLLVRASNTEPIIRFIAEAPTPDQAQALCDQAERTATAS